MQSAKGNIKKSEYLVEQKAALRRNNQILHGRLKENQVSNLFKFKLARWFVLLLNAQPSDFVSKSYVNEFWRMESRNIKMH